MRPSPEKKYDEKYLKDFFDVDAESQYLVKCYQIKPVELKKNQTYFCDNYPKISLGVFPVLFAYLYHQK